MTLDSSQVKGFSMTMTEDWKCCLGPQIQQILHNSLVSHRFYHILKPIENSQLIYGPQSMT